MHLKKIEIQGFKSFADKVEIEFKEGITAIVGPNGSGKSNISDAIRWVLGEQSVKTLRGSKMEDIIFSGTSKRKALGYAEVTITFDNKDGLIPIDYQEIAITRRMFRSGESEYYLNKSSCRLKDIKELFMDTGVGKDGYSIIGQGRVDEILSSRPEERRNIFEEAAGIVKYKTKKIEAEKKLEKTKDNLIRIKDIIYELENQSEHLKKQSEKATKFFQLSNRLKELDVNLFIRKIDKLEEEIDKAKEEERRLQIKIDKIKNEKNTIEGNFNSLKTIIEDMDSSISIIQDEKTKTYSDLSENKNNLVLLEEKRKFHIKDIERLSKEIEDLNSRLEELKREKDIVLKEIYNSTVQLNVLKENFNKRNINLDSIVEKIELKEKNIERERDKVIEYYNLITDKKSQINSILSFKDNISKRIKQIEKEIEVLLEGEKSNSHLLATIEDKKLAKEEEVVLESKKLANLKVEERDYKEKLDSIYKQINENKIELQGKISNFNLLKNMQDDYEGYYKSVKNLMVRCKKDEEISQKLVGVVADLIRVEEKYEKAIDTSLGGSLQNIITKDEEDAKSLIDYLRRNKLGRVTFLPISTIKGKPIYISPDDRERYNIIGLGSELVNCDEVYKDIIDYLLGRTIVVKDLNHATLVAKKYNYYFRIVTLDGDIINIGGSMTGGSLPKVSGNLLNRKHRIESIKEEINNFSKVQDDLEREKNLLKSKVEESSIKLREREDKLHSTNIEIIRIENEINKHNTELKRIGEAIRKYKDEIKTLDLELKDIIIKEEEFNEELKFLNKENDIKKEEIKELMLRFEEEKAIKEMAIKEATDAKIEINSLENRLMTNEEKLEGMDQESENIINKIKLKDKESLRNKEKIDSIEKSIKSLETEINRLSILEENQTKEFILLKNKRDRFMKDYYLEQNRLKEINERIYELEKEKNNWELKEARNSVQLDNLNIKLLEEYELKYKEALDLWMEIEDINSANLEVRRLKAGIKELGTVNLSSIEEYRTVKERLEFITKQHNDLLLAKENLQEVIFDMESKMKKQFLLNFNHINENFNQVFSILFDGGKASLVLEDEENILTCGIEIEAQPPGKKLQNLTLLSGGEKSLTAVALLFAILEIKPTPFCILDEIDAALDEANINRYINYLKEFSDETQFIMITHRKGTMEMADVLYGVTMEEEGISKIVSVKLTDNLEEIAS